MQIYSITSSNFKKNIKNNKLSQNPFCGYSSFSKIAQDTFLSSKSKGKTQKALLGLGATALSINASKSILKQNMFPPLNEITKHNYPALNEKFSDEVYKILN